MNAYDAAAIAEKFAAELVRRTLSEYYTEGTVRLRVESLVLAAARAHGEAMGKALAEAKKGER